MISRVPVMAMILVFIIFWSRGEEEINNNNNNNIYIVTMLTTNAVATKSIRDYQVRCFLGARITNHDQ